jgi:hypothetical protein
MYISMMVMYTNPLKPRVILKRKDLGGVFDTPRWFNAIG